LYIAIYDISYPDLFF